MSTRLSLCDVRGPIADLLDKLSGEDGERWLRGLNKYLRGENPRSEVATYLYPRVFKVVVNYAQSLTEMISAGKYDWVSSNITADHFPMSGSGEVELNLELVHFGCLMESDKVLAELDSLGLRPAILPELLAFGAKRPDKQREFPPIIALGSVWRRLGVIRNLPWLWGSALGCSPDHSWFGRRWNSDCRFAAVRK